MHRKTFSSQRIKIHPSALCRYLCTIISKFELLNDISGSLYIMGLLSLQRNDINGSLYIMGLLSLQRCIHVTMKLTIKTQIQHYIKYNNKNTADVTSISKPTYERRNKKTNVGTTNVGQYINKNVET